jgi:hypothetical protein
MKANELRINNWVHRDSAFNTPLGLDLQITADSIKNAEKYSPIPLTEEWLLKFGFDRNILNANHNDIIYYSENNIAIKGMLGMVKPSQCIYVHQLQNLYFALTNEELIKE